MPPSENRPLLAAPTPAPPAREQDAPTEEATAAEDRRTPHPPRPPIPRYLGFEITPEGREYALQVTREEEARTFRFLIRHAAFAAREARFQDAPDLCYQRLGRELSADPDLPTESRFEVTFEELRDYRVAHQPGATGRPRRGSGR